MQDANDVQSNVYATGTNADDAWKAIGCSGQIPIQSDQGHWDEGCLVHEVMTPTIFQDVRNPLSNITVAAMADMGYNVNYDSADTFSLQDLGNCGAACPEASSNGGGRRLGSSRTRRRRRQLTKEVRMAIMQEFKDELINFHNRVKQSGFVQGKRGHYAMERVDVLLLDDDGHFHTVTVTYNDVKEM